uniref:Uncharacterized protein n=1 Tax=Haptolina brevifila TaxID=156173 RepID=A0A7S2BE33_9EUKA
MHSSAPPEVDLPIIERLAGPAVEPRRKRSPLKLMGAAAIPQSDLDRAMSGGSAHHGVAALILLDPHAACRAALADLSHQGEGRCIGSHAARLAHVGELVGVIDKRLAPMAHKPTARAAPQPHRHAAFDAEELAKLSVALP